MTSRPFFHALSALTYIVSIVTAITILHSLNWPDDSVLDPLLALSTLVLSVAVMAYLFFYQPVVLLLDHKREEAVRFFLRTIGTFAAGIALIVLIIILTHTSPA